MTRSSAAGETLVFDFRQKATLILLVEFSSGSPRVRPFAVVPEASLALDEDRRGRFRSALDGFALTGRPAAVLTWEEGILFRQLALPEMPPEDLKKAFLWEMKEKFAFDDRESQFAYDRVAESELAEGRETFYSVFYADRSLVDHRVRFVQSLGFDVAAVVPAPVALAHLAAAEIPGSGRDTLVFDVGYLSARVFVTHGTKNMLARTVLLGGQQLTELLTAPFVRDGHRVQLPPAEAEALKVREGAEDPQAAHIGLLRPYLEKIVAEIKRSVDYYETQKYSRPIGTVLFTGGGSNLKGLKAFMSQFLGLEIASFDPSRYAAPALAAGLRKSFEEGFGTFAAALGAVTAASGTVNLLPTELQNPRKTETRRISLRMATFAVASVFLVLDAWAFARYRAVRSELAAVESEWKEIARVHALLGDIEAQQGFIRAALKGDLSHPALLKELTRLTPAAVLLDEIEFSREAQILRVRGAVTGAGKNDVKVIAQFIGSLLGSPFFKDATLVSSDQDSAGLSRFEIRCVTSGIV